jgi:hypothetical protein
MVRVQPNQSIERTAFGALRAPSAAAHLERYASAPAPIKVASGLEAMQFCLPPVSHAGEASPESARRHCSAGVTCERETLAARGPRVAGLAAERGGSVVHSPPSGSLAAQAGSQNALRGAAPRPCRSSHTRRPRTQVPFNAGSHNLSFERTAFGRRSLTR